MLDQLEALDEGDAIEVRDARRRARRAHRLAGRPARARRVGRRCCRSFVKIFPTDYKRVLAELRGRRGGGLQRRRAPPAHEPRARRRDAPRRREKVDVDGRARGLPEDRARRRPLPRSRASASSDYEEFLVRRPDEELAGAGRALHGVRRAVLPQRLPAGQPHPGLERPRLPRPLARRDPPAARDEQLPRVHRPAVPGAVRGRLRAGDPRGRRGHDQADRELDHRPRVGGGLGRAAAARARDRPQRRRRRRRPGGHGRRAAAAPRRPRA